MTWAQPGPPPAPTPQDVARLRAENEALTVQLQNQALREGVAATGGGAPAQPAGRPQVGVVKGADGVITVTGRDGNTVRIDPRAVSDPNVVRTAVENALAPARPARGRADTSGEDVAVVAIIFPCLIVLMLIVWRIVATSRRPVSAAAGAAVGAELAGRLARIEQAIEAVAIEVERISESERYSARLLTERLPEPARQAERARPETPAAGAAR